MTKDAAASASMLLDIAHGGRLIEAKRLYPDAPEPWIDLSTGINPHAYPFAPLPDAAFTRLPEPEKLLELQTHAAAAYGAADAASVVAGPGTQILIGLLPYLLGTKGKPSRVSILGPTYQEHHAAWRAAGATIIEFDDPARFCAQAGVAGDIAILCNPNNPDGRLIAAAELRSLADRMAARGGWLICDEAFADLETPDCGLAGDLPHDGLLLLRSFGKAYGLAGVRLGFLLAAPQTAGRVRTILGPWAVSGPALSIGLQALADPSWRRAMRVMLRADCARLDALLHEAGCVLVGGTSLFRLYRSTDAATLFRQLVAHAILVRRLAHDPRLLRFGLPALEPDWSRLAIALHTQTTYAQAP